MSWNFVGHIIRDVFPSPSPVIVYGENYMSLNSFRSSEHGIETFLLHSDPRCRNIDLEFVYYWEIGINYSFFGNRFCNLFVSIDYDPRPLFDKQKEVNNQIKFLMNDGGKLFLVNPGSWANELENVFTRKSEIEKEIKRFTMFKHEKVYVYENI